jgi:osmotically-inducible protein OsmY
VLRSKQHRTLALLASIAVIRGVPAAERYTANRYFDDGVINLKVETALLDECSFKTSELVVATENRIVRLTGIAGSQAAGDRAAQVALAIAGVQSVRNDIRLKPN